MEFQHLAISLSLLLSLALAGESQGRAWLPEEQYWEAVWPNTPIPTGLRELLKPGPKGVEIDDLPMKFDLTQCPGLVFYEHDLYPTKITNVPQAQLPLTIYSGWDGIDDLAMKINEACVLKAPVKGESNYCAKSLETLMGFAISRLGKNIQPFSSSVTNEKEQYTIISIQNLGDKAVTCHGFNFGGVVFYCHQRNKTTPFMVSLMAADGTKTHAVAVCHKDTSDMNDEFLHKILKEDPGNNPICHFLGSKAVLWVPKLTTDNAYK